MTFTDINANLTGVWQGSPTWLDYDGDSDPDFLLTGANASEPFTKIYKNNGGVFTEDTAASASINAGIRPQSPTTGDFDKDGYLDLLIRGYNVSGGTNTNFIKIYDNDGSGNFTEDTAGSATITAGSGIGPIIGDFDGDDNLDFITSTASTVELYKNDGPGNLTFTKDTAAVANITLLAGALPAAADYDRDGDLDIFVIGRVTDTIFDTKIYDNDGSGNFTENTAASANIAGLSWSAISTGDYDSDGDLDLLTVGHDVSRITMAKIYNNDGGIFTEDTAASANLIGVDQGTGAFEDYDGDGDPDLAIIGRYVDNTTQNYTATIYRNDTPPPYCNPTPGDDDLKSCATPADDSVDGLAGNDTLNGKGGNDELYGNAGDDLIYGGNGDDTLWGDLSVDNGNDTIYGGLGADRLIGYAGNDELIGGDGNDELGGGDGADLLKGGNNNDTLYGDNNNDTLYGGNDDDVLYGGNDDDILYGGNDDDVLYGEDGNDTLKGAAGNDILNGDNKNDLLFGGIDNDILNGGDGADTLKGGSGEDTLIGGSGLDHFFGGAESDRFRLESTTTANRNIIRDFEDGIDLLELSGNLSVGNLSFVQNLSHTNIIENATGERIAVLHFTDVSDIDQNDFI